MANVTKNPYVIDTFSADVVVSTGSILVSSIVFKSAAAGDLCVFIDSSNDICFYISNNVNGGSVSWTPSKSFNFQNGLTLDVSACTGIGTGDHVLIFHE